ncbi:unnamed protein product [Phaeothamnion confervicola]
MQAVARAITSRAAPAARAMGRCRPVAACAAARGPGATPAYARGLAVLSERLDAMDAELPMREAVRYVKGNVKWTVADLKTHSDALACGLVDLGLKSGDSLLVFLPEGPEKHLTQIAAARTGMVCACADPTLATATALAALLAETAAAAVVVEESALPALTAAVPELSAYDDASGRPFRSEKFPRLRILAHTGFDLAPGVACLRHLLVYNPMPSPLPALKPAVKPSAPVGVNYAAGADGKPVRGATLSQADVVAKPDWATVHAIANSKYVEV